MAIYRLSYNPDLVVDHPSSVEHNTLFCRRLVASVVDRVRYRALNALGKNLLDLLGDDGVLAVVQGVCLGGRLAGSAAGRVDLEVVLAPTSLNYPAKGRSELICIPCLGEPPQDPWVQHPEHSWEQRTRPGRGTFPDRIRWQTFWWTG